jgi:3-hydroxyacyl-[acyl-carrier-protein] dehydratase
MLPSDVIRNRDPFLFIQEVVESQPDVSATCTWKLSPDDPVFTGHFPGHPVLPGVLIVEALGQTAGVCFLTGSRYGDKLLIFAGFDRVRFRREVLPGDTLQLQFTTTHTSARATKGTGTATVDGEVACTAELLFVVIDE